MTVIHVDGEYDVFGDRMLSTLKEFECPSVGIMQVVDRKTHTKLCEKGYLVGTILTDKGKVAIEALKNPTIVLPDFYSYMRWRRKQNKIDKMNLKTACGKCDCCKLTLKSTNKMKKSGTPLIDPLPLDEINE